MAGSPLVTVSLVTHDGAAWLAACLDSVAGQEVGDYELVIRDNASSDGSVGLLRARAQGDPRIRLIESSTNLGYAVAHDDTIAQARGRYVMLLNQDVVLDPGFLGAAVGVLERRPGVASVQGRIRRLGPDGRRLDMLDTTGLLMDRGRRAVSRDHGEPDDPARAVGGPVWGVDGPAPLHRLSALLDARLPAADGRWEVLDRDFFMQKEDVDLAWRLRLLGWEAWYEPAALAWHARGTGDSGATALRDIARANRAIGSTARRVSWRNQRLMQLKNEQARTLLADLPWVVAREALTLGYLAVVDPRALLAIGDVLRAAPAALRKRRALQARIRQPGRTGGPPSSAGASASGSAGPGP